MALWGISTTTETETNNFAIPKDLKSVDRNYTPHNCFADNRGWIYRRYGTTEQSGLSTTYYDEVLVPVAGLNTAGRYGSVDLGATGLGTATMTAVFFEDPNKDSSFTVSGGSTTGVTAGTSVNVHVCYNENVFVSAGATVKVRVFDANDANESTSIIGYAASVGAANYNAELPVFSNENGQETITNFNGQITNRVSFALTAPAAVLNASVPFNITTVAAGNAIGIGSTVIYITDLTNVSTASSVSITSVGGTITKAAVVAVGDTSITVGTSATTAGFVSIAAGTAVTFTNHSASSKMFIDLPANVVGTITDFSGGGAAFKTIGSQIFNVGGAGTTGSVGLGTTTISVFA
jgi:hypothetical protein